MRKGLFGLSLILASLNSFSPAKACKRNSDCPKHQVCCENRYWPGKSCQDPMDCGSAKHPQ